MRNSFFSTHQYDDQIQISICIWRITFILVKKYHQEVITSAKQESKTLSLNVITQGKYWI